MSNKNEKSKPMQFLALYEGFRALNLTELSQAASKEVSLILNDLSSCGMNDAAKERIEAFISTFHQTFHFSDDGAENACIAKNAVFMDSLLKIRNGIDGLQKPGLPDNKGWFESLLKNYAPTAVFSALNTGKFYRRNALTNVAVLLRLFPVEDRGEILRSWDSLEEESLGGGTYAGVSKLVAAKAAYEKSRNATVDVVSIAGFIHKFAEIASLLTDEDASNLFEYCLAPLKEIILSIGAGKTGYGLVEDLPYKRLVDLAKCVLLLLAVFPERYEELLAWVFSKEYNPKSFEEARKEFGFRLMHQAFSRARLYLQFKYPDVCRKEDGLVDLDFSKLVAGRSQSLFDGPETYNRVSNTPQDSLAQMSSLFFFGDLDNQVAVPPKEVLKQTIGANPTTGANFRGTGLVRQLLDHAINRTAVAGWVDSVLGSTSSLNLSSNRLGAIKQQTIQLDELVKYPNIKCLNLSCNSLSYEKSYIFKWLATVFPGVEELIFASNGDGISSDEKAIINEAWGKDIQVKLAQTERQVNSKAAAKVSNPKRRKNCIVMILAFIKKYAETGPTTVRFIVEKIQEAFSSSTEGEPAERLSIMLGLLVSNAEKLRREPSFSGIFSVEDGGVFVAVGELNPSGKVKKDNGINRGEKKDNPNNSQLESRFYLVQKNAHVLWQNKHTQRRVSEKQLGWNCFDVAVGLQQRLQEVSDPSTSAIAVRKALVQRVLADGANAETRKLLAPEIKHAAAVTVAYMLTQDDGQKDAEVHQLLEIAGALDADDRMNAQSIHQKIDGLLKKGAGESGFPAGALPAKLRTDELRTLVTNYIAAHDAMGAALIACNEALGNEEGSRLNLDQIDSFFEKENNSQLHAFAAYQSARETTLAPAEKAFQDYCERQDVFETYVSQYYGTPDTFQHMGWVCFQRSLSGECNTSMADIIARVLTVKIEIYCGDERAHTCNPTTGGETLRVNYVNGNHFEQRPMASSHLSIFNSRPSGGIEPEDEIDESGYRSCAVAVVINESGEVLMGCRSKDRQDWQFPQGGVHVGETWEAAAVRECCEEVELGFEANNLEIIGLLDKEYSYDVPVKSRRDDGSNFTGQKQQYTVVHVKAGVDCGNSKPKDEEFEECRWVHWEKVVDMAASFKKETYKEVMVKVEALGLHREAVNTEAGDGLCFDFKM